MPRRLALGRPGRKTTTAAVRHSQARRARIQGERRRANEADASALSITVDELHQRRSQEAQCIIDAQKQQNVRVSVPPPPRGEPDLNLHRYS
jgi:hypothetical protein